MEGERNPEDGESHMTIIVERTKVIRGARCPSEPIKRFDTLPEAIAWVRAEYKGCSKQPMYMDTKSRGTIQCGAIYRVKADGEHWVSFSEVTSETKREAKSIDVGRELYQPGPQ